MGGVLSDSCIGGAIARDDSGLFRKRCRSPTDSVPSATPALGALTSMHADLLPPRKRIRGFIVAVVLDDDVDYSYEPYIEPDIDSDIQADIDTCIAAVGVIASRETSVRVEIRVEMVGDDEAGDEAESSGRGMIEIGVDLRVKPVVVDDILELVREDFPDLVNADGSLERDHVHRIITTSQQSAAMLERIGTLENDNMRLRGMSDVERQRVNRLQRKALEARDAARNLRPIPESKDEQEDKNDDGYLGGNSNEGGNGNGNGNGGGNGNGDPNMKFGGFMPVARDAVTWWNSYKRTVGIDAAYAMTWKELMKLMTEVYFPRNETQKMETKLWNLTDEEDKKLKGYARNAENKKRLDNNQRDNHEQQPPPFKRQNVGGQNMTRSYAAGNNERKGDYKAAVAAPIQRALVGNQTGVTCYECGRQGHYRSDCSNLKDQNCGNKTGNKTGNNGTKARAYALGGGGTNLDSNVVTGTFLLNNCYASMLFDSGADRSFM
ncbi:putative reverse transcriptase domain-containing protein [Tanacetum coccineum]